MRAPTVVLKAVARPWCGGQCSGNFAGAEDFVAQFDEEAFGGFFAMPGQSEKEFEVGVGDGGLEGVGGEAAEEAKGGLGRCRRLFSTRRRKKSRSERR